MADAADRLRPAFQLYDAVRGTHHPDWRSIETYLFRGRTSSLDAVAWHKTFLKAVRASLPSNVEDRIETLFAACQRDPSAASFARLAGFLRDCHLRFTAPGTASFGGTYNIRADEFERTSVILDYDLNERLPEERWIRTNPAVLDFAYKRALRNWSRGDAKLQALAMLQQEEAPHADVRTLFNDEFMEAFIEYLETRRQAGGGQIEALRELQRASRDHADTRRLRRHLADIYEEKRRDYERWRRVMAKASAHLEWGLEQAEKYGEENLRATLHDTSVVKPVADVARMGALVAEVAALKVIERWKDVTELDRRVWQLDAKLARPA